MAGKQWTQKEDLTLKKNYNFGASFVAGILVGRTLNSIHTRAHLLGLKSTFERKRKMGFVCMKRKQKECTDCHSIKPFTDFFNSPRHSTGCEPKCKECKYRQKTGKDPKEKIAKKILKESLAAEGKRLCPRCGEVKFFSDFREQQYYCKDCNNAASADWYQNNVAHVKDYNKSYRTSERGKKAKKEWQNNNPEKVKEYEKNYRQNNPVQNQRNSAIYRAAKMNLTQDSYLKAKEDELRAEMLLMTKYTGKRYAIDHIFPLAMGGPHHHENLQILSWSANSSKSDRLNYRGEGIHWTDLKTHVLEMIDPAKLLVAYQEIGVKPPKRIRAHLAKVN